MQPHKSLYKKNFSFLLFVLAFIAANSLHAQGNLLVTPRRVLLDSNKRVEEINLINTGKDTARYVISLVEMEMNENGSIAFYDGDDSGKKWSSPYLRYYPHDVVLAPDEAQIVKVQYSRSADLTPGEYRSHMYFRAKADGAPLGDSTKKTSKSISVSLSPTFGICIPIIIRVGNNQSTVTLSQLGIDTKEKETNLKITLKREGNMSVYGDLLVHHIAPDGKVTKAGFAKGIAVYTSIPQRHFTMPLENGSGINYHKGRLQVTFTENNTEANKLAEADLNLK